MIRGMVLRIDKNSCVVHGYFMPGKSPAFFRGSGMPVEHMAEKLITLFIQTTGDSTFRTVVPRSEAERMISQWIDVRGGNAIDDRSRLFLSVKYRCCVTTICLLSVVAMGTDECNIMELEEQAHRAEMERRSRVEEAMSSVTEAFKAAAKKQTEGEEWRDSLREDDDEF